MNVFFVVLQKRYTKACQKSETQKLDIRVTDGHYLIRYLIEVKLYATATAGHSDPRYQVV